MPTWAGRLDTSGIARLYLNAIRLEPTPPFVAEEITLHATERTTALADDDGVHGEYQYFLEVRGLASPDGFVALRNAVHTCLLWCDTALQLGPGVGRDTTGTFIFERYPSSPVRWGHTADTLPIPALVAMGRFAPLVNRVNRGNTSNPFANAFRLYTAALTMEPSDVALVSFVSALEGLYTTSGDNISYRFALAIATFLEQSKEARRSLFNQAKQIYTVRSKTVHGVSISRDVERTAISLAESYTPLAEDLCRRSLRRILELGLLEFVKSDRQGMRGQLFVLLALGYSLDEAASELQIDLTQPGASDPRGRRT